MASFSSFEISASGMDVERRRLDVAAFNLANAQTTRTGDGSAFRRKVLLVRAGSAGEGLVPTGAGLALPGLTVPGPVAPSGLAAIPAAAIAGGLPSVLSGPGDGSAGPVPCRATVVDDEAPPRRVHMPGHPDADAQGWVTFPNVEPVTEMVEVMAAVRAYEANAAAFGAARDMAVRAIDIGR